MTKEQVARINELARKKKTVGLTESELKEQAALRGDCETAAAIQRRYQRLMNLLFREVNPIPVKAAAAMMGLCENEVRLPLKSIDSPYYHWSDFREYYLKKLDTYGAP